MFNATTRGINAMTGNRYWLHYCIAAGLSKEAAKRIVAECAKRSTFSDIDYRIKLAKQLAKT